MAFVAAFPALSGFAAVRRSVPFAEPSPGAWLHLGASTTDASALAVACRGGAFLLRFPGLADFAINLARPQVEVWPMPGTDDETVRHLLLDQVLPRMLAHQGRLVLHAGAVNLHGRGLAFSGPSGSGKSTLAASLQRVGYPLLSDDGLLIDLDGGAATVQATYPSLRLWPDALDGLFDHSPLVMPMAHYSTKRTVVLASHATYTGDPLPVAALFVLDPDPLPAAVTIRRLSPADACMAIVANAFQLDPTDRARLTQHIGQAAALAQRIPVYRLAYPREFGVLPAVHAALLDCVAADAQELP